MSNRTLYVRFGEQFNHWIVEDHNIIYREDARGINRPYVLCKCLLCEETIKEVRYCNLVSGRSKQCEKCSHKKRDKKDHHGR